jgi:branched-subunit amino acid aminotransferase/4-amino-4-deoxychorismate lyase
VLAIREARKQGAYEALIVDGRGCVLEGTTSNVFLVKDGGLVTATEESGILSGITRAYLIRAAERLGIRVDVRDIGEQELPLADELFRRRCARCPRHASRWSPGRQRETPATHAFTPNSASDAALIGCV